MSAEDGHNYRFGAPSKGWPKFCSKCGRVRRSHSDPRRSTDPIICGSCALLRGEQ